MSLNHPLVSIIMPAYNAANYISKAIQSILDQTYVNFELLVADDGSTDNTKEIIDSFKDYRIKRYHNENNIGNIKTCNILFSFSKGEFIAIQDADDWSSEDRIQKQVHQFVLDPSLSACCTQCYRTDKEGAIIKKTNFPLNYDEIKKNLPENFFFHCTSIMIKKEVYDKIGGYNSFFERRGGADWYWVSLIIDLFKLVNLDEHLYYYRSNPSSVTQTLEINKMLYTNEIIRYLIKQRNKCGVDSLMVKDFKHLEDQENLFRSDKLFVDKILLFEDFADKNYKKAFKKLSKILKKQPFQSISFYRNVFYYFRKVVQF